MKLSLYKFALLTIFISSSVVFAFAQTERERGIELYQKGDFQSAIVALRESGEVKDLYYLGLSYEKIKETGKAKDAFKKSLAKSYDFFFKTFNEWDKNLMADEKRSFSDLLLEMKENNEVGLLAAEKAYSLKSDIFQTNEWRIKAKALADIVKFTASPDKSYTFADKSISIVKITDKPRAVFPKDMTGAPIMRAKKAFNKSVIVTIFAVFGADGKIKLLIPVDDLVDIYTGEALKAASKIKYEPATKDGKPVTSGRKVQYSFSIGS